MGNFRSNQTAGEDFDVGVGGVGFMLKAFVLFVALKKHNPQFTSCPPKPAKKEFRNHGKPI